MSTCAILLSYKRPQNMQKLVDSVLSVPSINHIILSNNNPEIDIFEWVSPAPRLELINQPTRRPCAKRFDIAASREFDIYYCPDDDLFISPKQIEYLLARLAEKPEVPHGMYGQIGTHVNNLFTLSPSVFGVTCEVDILNRIYVFTKQHADQLLKLSAQLGWPDVNDAIHMDDALLSFSGFGKPVVHDIGEFEDCPTSNDHEIATCWEAGFVSTRMHYYKQLLAITGRTR